MNDPRVQKLKEILETVVFEDANLVVRPYYTNNATAYPYLFILDDSQTFELVDNGTCFDQYDYSVAAVFRADENEAPGVTEERMRALKAAIATELRKKANRHTTPQSLWHLMKLTRISSPFSAGDVVKNADNDQILEFTISIYVESIFN